MTQYNRVFNFSAGPANLPVPVLEQVRDELLNYKNSGMSVMEMSHRSKEFDGIMDHSIAITKELLGLGNEHEVLFLQGGASLQFSMVPMNLMESGKPIDVVHTGYWVEMAMKEFKRVGEMNTVFNGEGQKFTRVPKPNEIKFSPNASFAYLCSNNTIEGTQMKQFPTAGNVPMVADMSSDFLSRRFNAKDFGLIFAGAQKNLGPSGVTMVILRKDLVEKGSDKLPTMLQYRTHVKGGSRYNTPPAFSIYVCGLVMDWIKKNGGLSGMEEMNRMKAKVIYDAIDAGQGFYSCPVDKESRSDMNIVFRVKVGTDKSEELETALIGEAKKNGLLEIKGHRSVGGLRASLYNAHPLEGAKALADLMHSFAKKNC
jgi:phosphoserine aminotransferase